MEYVQILILFLLIFVCSCNNNEYKVTIEEEIDIYTDIYNLRIVLINFSKQHQQQQQHGSKKNKLTTTLPNYELQNDNQIKEAYLNLNHKYLNVTFSFLDSTKYSNEYFEINNQKLKLVVKQRIDRDSLCENKLIKTCNCNSHCILKLEILANGYIIDKNSLKNQLLLTYNNDDESYEDVDMDLINESIASNLNNYFYHIFTLKIHILDKNDNKPYFLRSEYTIDIPENVPIGHRIPLQLVAYDSDYGTNSIVKYKLINYVDLNNKAAMTMINQTLLYELNQQQIKEPGIFEIDYNNLKSLYLKVNVELDREVRNNYTYFLVAIDGGKPIPLFGFIKFFIKILDHNDNSPYFKEHNLRLNISENTPIGTKLLTITAYDSDDGQNGQIEYFLVLNKNFQQQKFLNYQDNGNGNLASSNKQQNQQHQQINDDDNNYFKIDKFNGELYLKENLDYEKQNYFKLVVSAIDKGIPSLYSINQCIVEIYIYDENDNAPEIRVITSEQIQQQQNERSSSKTNTKFPSIQQQQTLYLSESAPISTFICLITINDVDTGQNGNFEWSLRIQPNDSKIRLSDSYTKIDQIFVDNNNFSPTMKTFALLVAKPLDRESQPHYKIQIHAKDFGIKKRLESDLSINLIILDVNDNKPEFKQIGFSSRNDKPINSKPALIQYNYFINENNLLNSKIGCFECFDRDENENGEIDYYLSVSDIYIETNINGSSNSEHINNLIRVDSNDKCLYALISFDRELKNSYEFYIIAIDRAKFGTRLNSSAMVHLYINDVNDHVPYFSQSKYVFNLTENSPANTIIGQIKAFDFDANDNSKLEFKLTPESITNSYNLIKLNANNGFLTYAPTNELHLDADNGLTEFNLVVHVNDKGVPSFGTTCQVQIKIIDINDNCPRISSIAKSDTSEHIVKVPSASSNEQKIYNNDDIEAVLFYIDRDTIIKNLTPTNVNFLIGRFILIDNDRDFSNNQPTITNQEYKKFEIKKLNLPLEVANEIKCKKNFFNLTSNGHLYFNPIYKTPNYEIEDENEFSNNGEVIEYINDSGFDYYLPPVGLYKINFYLSDNSITKPCILKTKFILIAVGDGEKTKNDFIKLSINLMEDIVELNKNLTKGYLLNDGLTASNTNGIRNNMLNRIKSLFYLDSSNKIIILIFFVILLLIIILLSILCIYCVCQYNKCCSKEAKYKAIATNGVKKPNGIGNGVKHDNCNGDATKIRSLNEFKYDSVITKNGHIEINKTNNYYTSNNHQMKSSEYKLLIEHQNSLDSTPSNKYNTMKTKLNGSVESTYSASSSTSTPITTSTIASLHANKNRSVLV